MLVLKGQMSENVGFQVKIEVFQMKIIQFWSKLNRSQRH